MTAAKPGGRDPKSEAAEGRRRHLEALLDAALEATFPASDPVALATPPAAESGDRPRKNLRAE